MGFWDHVLSGVFEAGAGMSVGVEGPVELIAASLGSKIAQELIGEVTGSHKASSSPPTSSPGSSSTPGASSGDQGLAATAAAAQGKLLSDYNNVMGELDQNQVSVSDVQAEAQAAQTAVEALVNEIDNETAELRSATSPAQITSLQGAITSQLGEIQTIISQQNNLAQAEAEAANKLAQQYAGVATGSGSTGSGSTGTGSTGAGSTGTGTGTESGTSTGSTGSTTGTGVGTTDPYTLTSATNPYAAQEAAAQGGSGADSDEGMMDSLLPEMMMPAMMLPGMLSSLGSQGAAQSAAPARTQVASDVTPSGAGSGPQSGGAGAGSVPQAQVVGHADDGGGGDPKQPGADAGTQPASVQPAGNAGALPVANTDVKLPDGTSTRAPNAQAATAVRAALSGASAADAYQQAGVTLSPPGTPVISPVAPGELQAGDVGVWKDHQVIALGADKVLVNGQVQPESSIGSSPDFLGWMRPTQQSSPPPATAPPATASPAAPALAATPGLPTPAAAPS